MRNVLLIGSPDAIEAAHSIAGHLYDVVALGTDLTTIHGRNILAWPDADDGGVTIMTAIATTLTNHCPEVKFIHPPAGYNGGFNASHAHADGWDWDRFKTWAKPNIRIIQPKTTVPDIPTQPEEPPPGYPEDESFQYDLIPSTLAWRQILITTKSGAPIGNLDNVVRCIEHDPDLTGKIWYDEFLDAIITTWQGPQRKWRDSDDVLLQLYLQRHVGILRIGATTCHEAALVAAFRNIKNECRDWMESLTWDGTPRLTHLLSDGFGADHSEYTEAVGRCWMISMVARIYRPGCKVDTVPVFEGSQGSGKSSAMSALGGKWFTECHESITTKDFYGVLDGHMLVEIAEMHSFTRSEVERIKGVISCQVDRYRKSYGRNTEDHPRQSVLTCTTNRDDWQRDDTGARRFWPVLCQDINLDFIRTNREQLFAEAVSRFKSGENWWDVPGEEQKIQVERRREDDSWEPVIENFLIGKSRVFTHEILSDCLKMEIGKHDQISQKRVGRILRLLGWEKKQIFSEGKNRKVWLFVSQCAID